MMMTEESAKAWAKDKKNQDEVVRRFFEDFPPTKKRLVIFMAGIPGAGKTEFTENTIAKFEDNYIPLEHDKLVGYIEGYSPEHYYIFRKAGSILVTRVFDECIKNGYSFVFDGTLSHEQGYKNIKKTLNSGYFVRIIYIVQSAKTAWGLTQDREVVKKRAIEKTGFIDTCNKINTNLITIFQDFKENDHFGFWVINKNGQVGMGSADTILYPLEVGSTNKVENMLNMTYSTSDLA